MRKTRLSREEKLELGLAQARASIRKAANDSNLSTSSIDYIPSSSVYHNPRAFYQLVLFLLTYQLHRYSFFSLEGGEGRKNY